MELTQKTEEDMMKVKNLGKKKIFAANDIASCGSIEPFVVISISKRS